MSDEPRAAPPGVSTVSPYLTVPDVPRLIDFLVRVFDGVAVERIVRPDGVIGHAEVRIVESLVMLGTAHDGHPATQTNLYVYVRDVDATFAQALAAGGEERVKPADTFYGDRCGAVRDPAGNTWWIATNKERLTQAEIQARLTGMK